MNGAIGLTKEREVCNLYVHVSPNEKDVEVERSRAAVGFWQVQSVRLREMSAPSDGGEEAVAPGVPPSAFEADQGRADEHHATGHAALSAVGVRVVSEVVDVCHHT